MSYIQVTNQFLNTTPLLATACNQNFADITSGMSSGLNDFNVAQFTANGSATVAGDIYTVSYFDWFPQCNAVGWNSYLSIHNVYVKKIGKTVFIDYEIQGLSSSTTAYFSLPYNVNSNFLNISYPSFNYWNIGPSIGLTYFPSQNIVAFNPALSFTSQTWNAGNAAKIIYGTLIYEAQ